MADRCTCSLGADLPPLEHARTCLVYVGAIEAALAAAERERDEASEDARRLQDRITRLTEGAEVLRSERAMVYARAISWCDYFLAMPLVTAADHAVRQLRSKLAHERDHGPLTSTLMGEHRPATKEGT